jgi:hypothetical protein
MTDHDSKKCKVYSFFIFFFLLKETLFFFFPSYITHIIILKNLEVQQVLIVRINFFLDVTNLLRMISNCIFILISN